MAVAVRDDGEWSALTRALGYPSSMRANALADEVGRRARSDAVDQAIADWTRLRDVDEVVDTLLAQGVPAARVVEPLAIADNEQIRARGFLEVFDHAVAGRHATFGMPFSLASHSGPWIRTAAPTLGADNRSVLQGSLGLTDDEYARLEADGVVGDEVR